MKHGNFSILDRNQTIQGNLLLEASAGTGKTFSIENLVVRLLLSDKKIPIEKILIVTFTRMATKDLKLRIRSNIENAIACLQGKDKRKPPDYLQAILERDSKEVQEAIRLLKLALLSFDTAQIFTIHGFCSRMLRNFLFESEMHPHHSSAEDNDSALNDHLLQCVRDFLRTGLLPHLYSQAQLNIILKSHDNKIETLEQDLLNILKTRLEIAAVPAFAELLKNFKATFPLFKQKYSPEKIVEDFLLQAPNYEKLCDKQKKVKQEILNKIEKFARLFGRDVWEENEFEFFIEEGLFPLEALHSKNQKSKIKDVSHTLNYPGFYESLRNNLLPLVAQARSPALLFARMAYDCQKLTEKNLSEKELFRFDDLLHKMSEAVLNPEFVHLVRSCYQIAIIDEFQDTDPLQWSIFKKIFVEDQTWGNIYLVGDPKQSIYSFRQADIYTYLDAAALLGEKNRASLNTNYRSQPALLDALNLLFDAVHTPKMIELPRIKGFLDYRAVKSGVKKEKDFQDDLGMLHFFISSPQKTAKLEKLEDSEFFPFIYNEIIRLQQKDAVKLNQIAILVKDKFQGQRLVKFLLSNSVDAVFQKQKSLKDGLAIRCLIEILNAVAKPRDPNFFKIVLGSRIIGWTHSQVRELEQEDIFENWFAHWQSLSKFFYEYGFAYFFEKFLESSWHADKTLSEKLLTEEGGVDFYNDLTFLAELLEENKDDQHSPLALLKYIHKLNSAEANEEALYKRAITDRDAVQVLTLHASKGLEYEIVFALGLASRHRKPEGLIPLGSPPILQVINEDSQEYKNYCEELDAEKMRQFYVAATRAKFRLYLPVILEDSQPEMGRASPMELFLARLNQPATDYTHLYERMQNSTQEKLLDFITVKSKEAKISYHFTSNETPASHLPSQKIPELLPPPPLETVEIPLFNFSINSFSSIAKWIDPVSNSEAPHDFATSVKSKHTLPAGAETGILLHLILEKISFRDVSQAEHFEEILPLIDPFVKNSSFAAWNRVIAEMIFKVLKTPMKIGETTFALCDIPEHQRFHETVFLFSHDEVVANRSAGFFKGVIDLFFRYENKYYLLDWKSNWLGPDDQFYQDNHLFEAMKQHDYFTQAEIYASAVERYLKMVEKRPFKDVFGGAIYLFMRGTACYCCF